MGTERILVFGDSLSAGYQLPQDSGWVALLQRKMKRERPGTEVVNASISGETTSGGATRIEAALTHFRPTIVILELGANDGLRGLPVAVMRSNLEHIIAACRRSGARVLLLGMRLPPNYGSVYDDKFRAVYAELGRTEGVGLVPFWLEKIAGRREHFLADGLHPNAEAQPILLETIVAGLGAL